MGEDNIIILDVLRVERHKPRKCTCKVRRYAIDIVNRLVECECGMEHDPFEAIADLAYRHEELNRKQKQMNEQSNSWAKEKPHSVIFKQLERHYRKGEMLPHCPACDAMFDYKDIVSHTNSRFHKMLKAREAKKK